MPILGLYTKKEVENLVSKEKRRVKIEANKIAVKRIDRIRQEHNLEKILLNENVNTQRMNLEDAREIIENLTYKLHNLQDKEINRLEHIQNRTKSIKVKKRCESRILKYKEKNIKKGK